MKCLELAQFLIEIDHKVDLFGPYDLFLRHLLNRYKESEPREDEYELGH